MSVEIPVTPELLLLADREFVYAVYQKSTGPLVRAGALTAFGGTAQQQREFISTGILAAREQDRLNEIAADQERTEAERKALQERNERIQAAGLFLVAADEGLLAASDESFVRWVWTKAAPNSEVYAAAVSALRSSDPAVWSAFIHTGIEAAFRRDTAEALRQIGLVHRAEATKIMNEAEAAGRLNLARAARAALAGSDDDVATFVRVGRHQVSDNECANPVLAATKDGWGAHGTGLVGTRQAITDHPSAQWEFAVANSTGTTAAMYLPRQRVLPGAVWDFSLDARTLDAARARMEVDWYSATDAYLGHTNGGFVDVPGTRAFTKVSARFTAPPAAVRAQVLARATELNATSGFASTLCSYQPNPAADVTLTATPGNGTVSIAWQTTRTDITGWNVGRDGTDTRGNGPWNTERPADARTHQFNLLTNETFYSFTVIPRTASGSLTPVTVSVKPTATPPAGGNGTEAAKALNWGTPLAAYSDEFDYTGPPVETKWSHTGECVGTPHHPDARRCASTSTVRDGKLVMSGTADGRSGWLGNKWKTQYGRWEARVRSQNTATSNGNTYHPLLIIWPSNDEWPGNGEYDFLENMSPGEPCAKAFLHYPHPQKPVQQVAKTEPADCGAPLSEWHNIAFEWTADHIRGYVDGRQWFSLSGGGNSTRRDIQTMTNGRLTIQFDNFDGLNMTPATYEADWVRVYSA
jgi:hypothetical protein